jgi:hypothetical protein
VEWKLNLPKRIISEQITNHDRGKEKTILQTSEDKGCSILICDSCLLYNDIY